MTDVITTVVKSWTTALPIKGGTIEASGTEGSDTITIAIDQPSTGMGVSETPGTRARAVLSIDEFNAWVNSIAGARQ